MNTLGEQLKKEREKKGITLVEVARVTKIRKTYLQALEEGDFDAQSPVFMKGFLKSYAEYLGLDSAEIIKRYKYDIKTEDELEAEPEVSASRRSSSRYLVPGIITLSLAIIIIIASIIAVKKRNTPPAPSTTIPPVTQAEATREEVVIKNTTTHPILSTVHEKLFKDVTAIKSTAPVKPAPTPVVAEKPAEKPEKTVEETGKTAKAKTNGKKHTLNITAKGTAWLRIAVDDGASIEVLMKKGETIDLAAERRFAVVTGNAGEIDITLNGKSLGSLGESGKIVSKVLPE